MGGLKPDPAKTPTLKATSFTVGFAGRPGDCGSGNLIKHDPRQKTHCLGMNVPIRQYYVK
jgi:hypothetical protein